MFDHAALTAPSAPDPGDARVSPRPAESLTALLHHLYQEFPRRARRVVDSPEVVLADPDKLRAVRAANLRRLFGDGTALDDLVEELWEEARGGALGALRRVLALLEAGRRPAVLVLKALDIFVVHHPASVAAKLRVPPLHTHGRFVRGNDLARREPWSQPAAPCEASLAYWTEDYDRNASHTKWHVVYFHGGIPDPDAPRSGERRFTHDRQGEQFLYMHQQMMARYNAERLCWRLPPVAPLDDYREVFADGYDPPAGLLQANAFWQYPFIARPAGLGLHHTIDGYDGTDTTAPNLERIERAIVDAIDAGAIPGVDGPLTEHLLGCILETNFHSRRHFSHLYGVEGLHNGLHDNLSIIGQPAYTTNFGVLGTTQDSSRDPLFYRVHQHLDDLRHRFAETQTPNDLRAHQPRGVTVVDFALDAEDGVLRTELGEGEFLYERGKLHHRPFAWRLAVRAAADATATRVTARIFICPAERLDDRRAWIEMDKFSLRIEPGADTTIVRADVAASVAQASPGPDSESDGERWCDCGWPPNLLLPAGRPEGARFVACVLLTADDLAVRRCSRCTRTGDEIVACGSLLGGGKYPDALGMGYPFNRRFSEPGALADVLSALPHARLLEFDIRLTHKQPPQGI